MPNPTNPQSFNRYSYVQNSPTNRIDPTGHVDCSLLGDAADTAGCNTAKSAPSPQQQPTPPAEPPSDLITHLPLDNITWQSGFGPNWYSTSHPDCPCYPQSHNIHTGLDFGGNAGDPVYATVSGEIVIEYAGDADPNVVIKITIGDITYYVVHGHVVIDAAIWKRLEAGETVEVTAGAPIGTLDDGPKYPHVHLGIRQKTEGQDRAWNPLLYMNSDLTVGMSFVSDAHPYYGNESPTSIRSFLYGTGSYFNEENQGAMGIIR